MKELSLKNSQSYKSYNIAITKADKIMSETEIKYGSQYDLRYFIGVDEDGLFHPVFFGQHQDFVINTNFRRYPYIK